MKTRRRSTMSSKSRSYFSTPYLCGAARYAREAKALEQAAVGGDDLLVHRAYVVASVTTAATALEAMVNEVFADAAENEGSCVAGLKADQRARLTTMWAMPNVARLPILDKFDVVHLLVTGVGLDRSHHRWRNAAWVVRLRNDFVHYEPSWQDHGDRSPSEQDKIERALKGLFPENALTGSGNPFYPDRLLGYGCATWAVCSAIEFADHFWHRLGLTPLYEGHRHTLAVQ